MSFIDEGILIIDELENGIHFSLFGAIAEFLMKTSKKKKLQFFIATHSDELIRAFVDAARRAQFDDICLINMSVAANQNRVRVFENGDLEFAIEQDAELRS